MAVNCWQYAREVYLVGRSLKYRVFTEAERAAVIEFIVSMAGTRPAYVPYINLKADNPPANVFDGESLVWDRLEKQNDYSLGKMVQKIGRSLKIQFCTEEEKAFCDALFEATDGRRNQQYNNYVTDNAEEGSSSVEEEGSSSVEEETSSSSVEEEESSSSAE